MDAVRLKQIEEIYQIAADNAPDHRAALLDTECSGDEALRREVESLLSFNEISDSFIDNSPDAIAAEMFADEEVSSPLIGKKIGHYKIQRLLGAGGMGEVYLAEDGKLGRRVAIKILPEAFTKDENRLRRFNQEARTASALNHPNILTIHEIGESNGSNYIATEFIDGETLRQKLNRERLSVAESLEIAIQTASAIAAAHDAGIIHRDIKPENIMLRRDNLVKVLDFGLAKLAEPKDVSVSHDAKTEEHVKTAPGVIMGTVQYMSPEQTRGHATDARTDIWSLGVVLYEMLAGNAPFKGENTADLIVEIMRSYPTPLSHTTDDVPERLDEIAAKALEKDPNERYQTTKDLLIDIRRLKRKLDLEHEAERSHSPAITSDRTSVASGEVARTAEVSHTTVDTGSRPINPLSSAGYIVSGIRRHKSWPVLAGLVIALALGAVIGLLVWQSGKLNPADAPEPPIVPVPAALVQMVAYSLTVQSFTDGRYKDPFKLSGEMLFRNKDRIRLNIASPNAGYLYILNEGPRGENEEPAYNILFPSSTSNDGSAALPGGKEIQVPGQSWFQLDEKEGTEFVWLVWSKNAIPELESAKRFANPQDRGRIKDTELSRTIGSILQKYQIDNSDIERDDDKKRSVIKGNTDIVAHNIKLEHH